MVFSYEQSLHWMGASVAYGCYRFFSLLTTATNRPQWGNDYFFRSEAVSFSSVFTLRIEGQGVIRYLGEDKHDGDTLVIAADSCFILLFLPTAEFYVVEEVVIIERADTISVGSPVSYSFCANVPEAAGRPLLLQILPVYRELHIVLADHDPIRMVRLVSTTGQVVYSSDQLRDSRHLITVSHLHPGLYVLQVQTFSGWHHSKVQIIPAW